MKREDLIILILGLLLLAGMLITIFFGGEKSKHGVGSLPGVDKGFRPAVVDGMLTSGNMVARGLRCWPKTD